MNVIKAMQYRCKILIFVVFIDFYARAEFLRKREFEIWFNPKCIKNRYEQYKYAVFILASQTHGCPEFSQEK